jgi:hypothetical protein
MANSKWLETSPIKSDNPFMESNQSIGRDREEENVQEGLNINLFQSKRQNK